jgi:hypothetical protein
MDHLDYFFVAIEIVVEKEKMFFPSMKSYFSLVYCGTDLGHVDHNIWW